MALPISFTGADGTAISALDPLFVEHPNYAAGAMTVLSNAITNATSSAVANYYNSAPPSADYSVIATIKMVNWTGACFVIGRASSSANTMYFCSYSWGEVRLYKVVAGSQAQLGSTVTVFGSAPASNSLHDLELRMAGTTIKVFFGGTERISVTDSAIAAAGFGGIRFDGFQEGTVFSAFTIPELAGSPSATLTPRSTTRALNVTRATLSLVSTPVLGPRASSFGATFTRPVLTAIPTVQPRSLSFAKVASGATVSQPGARIVLPVAYRQLVNKNASEVGGVVTGAVADADVRVVAMSLGAVPAVVAYWDTTTDSDGMLADFEFDASGLAVGSDYAIAFLVDGVGGPKGIVELAAEVL